MLPAFQPFSSDELCDAETSKMAQRKKSAVRPKKKAARNAALSDPKGMCFVVMPFGGWFDDYYDSVFRPAIEAAQFRPRRADDLFRPGTIVNDIWTYTKDADLILADLSGKNPNVLYELGLGHAIATPAILVTEDIGDVPFDLRSLRVIEYNKNDPSWGDLLMAKITTAIAEVSSSPKSAVLPAFLSVDEKSSKAPISERDLELLEIRREISLLRKATLESPDRGTDSGLGPREAKRLIGQYLELGLPYAEIAGRLEGRGVPEDFVRRVVRDHGARTGIDPLISQARASSVQAREITLAEAVEVRPTSSAASGRRKVAKKKAGRKKRK